MAAASVLQKRSQEEQYINNLNDRFQDYVARVRDFRENSSRVESSNLTIMTKALEDEIVQLKNLYENELQHLRDQFDNVSQEKNSQQLAASQNTLKVSDLEEKLADEINNRKNAEKSYADAQRTIAERDSQLEDARIELSQEHNAHLDTQKGKESIQNQLNQTTDLYGTESATKSDFENISGQLRDKLEFDRQRFEQEISEYYNRTADLETALRSAEERIHEHNVIDQDLAGQLAKVKIQSEVDFSNFKQESEMDYQNSLAHLNGELETKCKEVGEIADDNIKLKANIEELNARNTNAEVKAANTDNQNQDLVRTLELEREQATKTIKTLEEKQRELQNNLNGKISELNAAYDASLPISAELDSLGALLDAEERRLKVVTSDQPKVLTRTQFLSSAAASTRASPPTSVSGVKPIRRASSPKQSRALSRGSSVQPLPPVVGAPGMILRQNSNDGLHASLPEPLTRTTQTAPGMSNTPNFNFVDRGYPTTSPSRKYTRNYTGANRHSENYYTSNHRRFPTC